MISFNIEYKNCENSTFNLKVIVELFYMVDQSQIRVTVYMNYASRIYHKKQNRIMYGTSLFTLSLVSLAHQTRCPEKRLALSVSLT